MTPAPWLVKVIRLVPFTPSLSQENQPVSELWPLSEHILLVGGLNPVQKSNLIGNSSLVIRGVRPSSSRHVRSQGRNEAASHRIMLTLSHSLYREIGHWSVYISSLLSLRSFIFVIHASFVQIVLTLLCSPACDQSWNLNGTGLATLVNLRVSSFKVMEHLQMTRLKYIPRMEEAPTTRRNGPEMRR